MTSNKQNIYKLKGVQPRILVVDDEQSIREFLQIMLKRERMDVMEASNGKVALEIIKDNHFDLIISDIQMPELNGIELLEEIKNRDPEALVLMITAFGSTENAVKAMKLGAYDYLSKPFKIDEVKNRIFKALEKRTLVAENQRLKKALGERYSYANIVGGAPSMHKVFEMIKRVAPTDSGVLINGDSGTGKELVAKAIHYNSALKEQAFISVNCGAIAENLIESEMFGHVKGAFTGASTDKKGFFEAAHGGTLFLDEVGEMPMSMQVSLLRALADGSYTPVGGTQSKQAEARVIAATNRNLKEEVEKGTFREDLYFRLNVIQIEVPSLKQRVEDIPMLVDYFVEKFSERFGKDIHSVPTETMNMLKTYNWPGNVRELENIIERMVALEGSKSLLSEGLPDYIREPMKPNLGRLSEVVKWNQAGVDIEEILQNIEREFVLKAMEEADGVKKDAAKLLKVSMRSLRYRLEKINGESSDDESKAS